MKQPSQGQLFWQHVSGPTQQKKHKQMLRPEHGTLVPKKHLQGI